MTLLEYYFTKERVTLEVQDAQEETVSFFKQIKTVFSDKYLVIIYVYFLIYTLGSSIKNISLPYFCNYVLGTYNDGIAQTLLSVIGGIPMGIGIFAVWPLAKRFGKRNVTAVGFVLYAIGGVICWLFSTNMVMMLIGQFIKNMGGLPSGYVFMALFADVLDHVEWKYTFRCDGVAMSIYNVIAVAMLGFAQGIFNGLLAGAGYVAPYTDAAGNLVAVQNAGVQNIITFSFVGLNTIAALVLGGLLIFLNVEKDLGKKQAEIKARRESK